MVVVVVVVIGTLMQKGVNVFVVARIVCVVMLWKVKFLFAKMGDDACLIHAMATGKSPSRVRWWMKKG